MLNNQYPALNPTAPIFELCVRELSCAPACKACFRAKSGQTCKVAGATVKSLDLAFRL